MCLESNDASGFDRIMGVFILYSCIMNLTVLPSILHKQLEAGFNVGCTKFGCHSTATSSAGWSSSTQLRMTVICFATSGRRFPNSSVKDGASGMEFLNNVIK